jgi:hypothetical protein
MDLHELIMKIKITSACIGYAVEEAMKYDNDLESRLALAYKNWIPRRKTSRCCGCG